ncbi:bifunctional isocitrate dehydrogenase kinase/phosphatase [Marinibactrum halimedae]|uniref:Isocitrate dehydrogenase kinase/phosphatase n=1 Tax=Marinibactrum halimedae TaxID=1444977 RepID=A0AA37WKZ7_9GAMM|nr:bifunctional isocitrate dehydrogenase kinase/phosphatase [Marinibactrum halimedae]MCD9458737.1 bifunctional isocitrate dehydrogenase kinase/phosphatase [Marinibactrum halimedae]GLS25294.1 isocitrate dehydrogenase kinase/phosphatase [Marinibactrum halimedae]
MRASPTARRIAKTIMYGFDAYFADYQNITLGAKARFERGEWQKVREAQTERIDLYKSRCDQVLDRLEHVTSKSLHSLELWPDVKQTYAQLLEHHINGEIAETFFNTIFCKIFDHQHIHDRNLFVLPSHANATLPTHYARVSEPLSGDGIFLSYTFTGNPESVIASILDDFQFSIPWEDAIRDRQHLCDALCNEIDITSTITIDLLDTYFYRNKGAYLVGRVVSNDSLIPLVIPVLRSDIGIYVDSAIFSTDEVSVIFSFTRSHFFVESRVPSRTVSFLKNLMPSKSAAELYSSIGFPKHGKTEFYRDAVEHTRHSKDLYTIAPGTKGMVMVVFTLPSFEYVFKVIRDRFRPPKSVTEKEVIEKYHLVSRSDRTGRMADAHEYRNFIFYRNRFSYALIQELLELAPSKITLTESRIIIKHVYVERRMTPLNLYLNTASSHEIDAAMDEYGNAIKQLAAANIFPGDMLLKNFGVTRHGRVVFYDYDEIVPLEDCHFRHIPQARTEEDEMASQPWYSVAENDIFPEEFRLFFSGKPLIKQSFEQQHSDIYNVDFWQSMQEQVKKGHIADAFPYRRSRRFLNDYQ